LSTAHHPGYSQALLGAVAAQMQVEPWEAEAVSACHQRIHHTAISTQDADRPARVYRDLLGLRVVFEQSWAPARRRPTRSRGLWLRGRPGSAALGNAYLELFEFGAPEARPGDPDRPVCDHGITHVCFDVDDLDADSPAVRRRVASTASRQYLESELHDYGRDPDGTWSELQELTPAGDIRLPWLRTENGRKPPGCRAAGSGRSSPIGHPLRRRPPAPPLGGP